MCNRHGGASMRRHDRQPAAWIIATALCLLALIACGAHTPRHGDASNPTPGPVAVNLDVPTSQSLEIAGMPQGTAPRVPWIQGRVLHASSGDIPVGPASEPLSYWSWVFAYGNGAVRAVASAAYSGRPATMEFLGPSGHVERTVRASDPLLTTDRSRIAWWDYSTHELVIADTASGTELRRIPGPATWALPPDPKRHVAVTLITWMGADDVLATREAYRDGTTTRSAWRSSGKPVPVWFTPDTPGVFYSPGGGQVLFLNAGAAARRGFPEGYCLDSLDPRAGTLRWEHCYEHDGETYGLGGVVFSPDGAHVLLHAVNVTGGDPGFLLVLDPATGQAVTRFGTGLQEGDNFGYPNDLSNPVFEDNDHFVAVLLNRVHRNSAPTRQVTQTIVRCSVTGRCEQATTPAGYRDTGGTWPQTPYWLY